MGYKIDFAPYRLIFRQPAKTSRATMLDKETYFIRLYDSGCPNIFGLGECALFRGLSEEDTPDYTKHLSSLINAINNNEISLDVAAANAVSSIRFGLETAIADLHNGGRRQPFPSVWSKGESGITINGLVWMGTAHQMHQRITEKINAGFKCIKLKIGGIDFTQELELLHYIRSSFSDDLLEIRLDANGAFTPENALNRLEALSAFGIHSIEQPIRQGQPTAMARICSNSPIPIALDEELIGIHSDTEKREILETIRPAYIILKPSLCGGFNEADKWISTASSLNIGWWATSALESDIGLNAIAQWTSLHNPRLPQGLGTGTLYSNNFISPLEQTGQAIRYNPLRKWMIPQLNWTV